jgi:hypothetical protein
VGVEERSGDASTSTARTSPTVLSGLLAHGLIGSSTTGRLGVLPRVMRRVSCLKTSTERH